MALGWIFAQKKLDEVKTAVQAELTKSGIPSFASVAWEANELCVKIDKGGKSEFRMALKDAGTDTRLVETKRDIAFLHKPFVGKVESFVDQLMSQVGAKKA